METVELAPNEKRCSKRKEVNERRKLVAILATGNKKWKEVQAEIKKIHPDWMITTGTICNDVLWIRKNWPDKEVRSIELSPGNPILRKQTVACLNNGYISFPNDKWPQDCNYARVRVNPEKLQVEFNPCVKRLSGCKKVIFPNSKNYYRNRITIHNLILEHLDITRPIYELRDRAGFVIQFYEDDSSLLEPFTFWAKHGMSLHNMSALTTHTNWKYPTLTIADHLWPLNAEYALLKWNPARRKNANSYLDVTPVSRTRKTVLNRSLRLSKPIGASKCLKVNRDKNRISLPAIKFFKDNSIPGGNWDLTEYLPGGRLRFALSDTRAVKTIKLLNKTETFEEKKMFTPDGTFEDWLTEIGENDSQPKEQSEDIAS